MKKRRLSIRPSIVLASIVLAGLLALSAALALATTIPPNASVDTQYLANTITQDSSCAGGATGNCHVIYDRWKGLGMASLEAESQRRCGTDWCYARYEYRW